jgi:4-hydroxy-3-methylbut-2-enyl diphosphate reductase
MTDGTSMADAREPETDSGLLVCAPLRTEARAVRRGLAVASYHGAPQQGRAAVRRTGYGAARSAAQADQLSGSRFGMLAVAGVGGGLSADQQLGDLVVGTEITGLGQERSCPSAPLLAGELRRAGLRAAAGPVVTVPKLTLGRGGLRDLAATGALAVDLESSVLLGAAADRQAVVIRALSDTPRRPLLSPWVIPGGIAALRSLRLAGPALERWAAACRPRRVLLAGPRSFCAGVERAIEIVERALERSDQPVYVRKQIVHNSRVVADLEHRGAVFVDELDEVPDRARVVFSAHGVSPAVRAQAAVRGLDTIDATCPLVAKVHVEARRFAADGYLVVLIGHAGHEEVDGTLGEAPGSMVLVQSADDVAALRPADPAKVAYLMQTTLSVEEASGIVAALLDRFPAARGPGSDDICYATTNRQLAVRAIAAESDLVLVAGSANSSNSVRLVETAQRAGTPAYLVDDPADIELGWLAGAATIGLTAGASAPPAMISEIVAALRGLGPVEVSERVVTTESIKFSLPKEVRPT